MPNVNAYRQFGYKSHHKHSGRLPSSCQLPITLKSRPNNGARRSYNGGPYRTYHEGVDFSAYQGTPVNGRSCRNSSPGRTAVCARRHGADRPWPGHLHRLLPYVGHTGGAGPECTSWRAIRESGHAPGRQPAIITSGFLIVNGNWVDAERWQDRIRLAGY